MARPGRFCAERMYRFVAVSPSIGKLWSDKSQSHIMYHHDTSIVWWYIRARSGASSPYLVHPPCVLGLVVDHVYEEDILCTMLSSTVFHVSHAIA